MANSGLFKMIRYVRKSLVRSLWMLCIKIESYMHHAKLLFSERLCEFPVPNVHASLSNTESRKHTVHFCL